MGFDHNTALVAYDDPLALLSLGVEGRALAFVVAANGPSYRPVGALMTISVQGKCKARFRRAPWKMTSRATR